MRCIFGQRSYEYRIWFGVLADTPVFFAPLAVFPLPTTKLSAQRLTVYCIWFSSVSKTVSGIHQQESIVMYLYLSDEQLSDEFIFISIYTGTRVWVGK